MPRDPDQAVAAMRGQNLAWAIRNVPGTALVVVAGTMHAVLRDARKAEHQPIDRVTRYVESGVATFFGPMEAAAC